MYAIGTAAGGKRGLCVVFAQSKGLAIVFLEGRGQCKQLALVRGPLLGGGEVKGCCW
jgi:hypothetical protein